MQTFIVILCFFLVSVRTAPSPSCALNFPCPPPLWVPQWQLNLSTICQPGGMSGHFLPPAYQPWGLSSLDWSVGHGIWGKPNANDSTCEATSVENGRLIKKTSPGSRVFIYHNTELALQWIESQRAVMYDPTKAHWFLQYTDGKGNKNGTIYNEHIGWGDQFFWDFRVPEAADYFVYSIIKSVSNDFVDGSFSDDVNGFPEEHSAAPVNMNLTADEVTALSLASQDTVQKLIDGLIKANKYLWQAFSNGDNVGNAPSSSTCIAFMQQYCDPKMQSHPMTMQMSTTDQEQIVAAFLITRPPHGWLGFGWESDTRNWLPIFDLDVGEPRGLCQETSKGVFSREWSKGTAVLDCNTWIAVLPFNYNETVPKQNSH